MGQNFSWLEQVLSRTWTTSSRKPQRSSSKTMRWNRMHVLLQADQRPKQNHKNEILPAHPQELYLLRRELGLMSNHKNIRSPIIQCRRNWSIFFVMDNMCNWVLFFVMEAYLETMMERLNSGEKKIILRIIFYIVIIGLTKSGRAVMQEEEGHKKRFQCCSDSSGTILYLRALQGHSGRNLLDPSLQDNVIIPDSFFKYIYHVGCAINLHSIINSGLIPGGQNVSNRQTVFFLPVDPMDKEHKDPDTIDLEAPRLAQYMHKAWKKHQNTVYWVNINFALKKGLKIYQTRSNAIILHETLPAYCIPKVVRMETGEVIYEKVYASPRPPPKISLKHDWMKKSGSEVARQPEGEVARQAKSSQPSQPSPNPDHDRTGRPVVCPQRGAPRSQEIETRSSREEAENHDRTGRPVVCRDTDHERSMLNEVDIDFRIPGLPHSVVKQAKNHRVRELVKQMAREMGSPRQVCNRRRRTREGPEPACVCKHLSRVGGTRRRRMMN